MKAIVIYYSYSGNTKKVSEILRVFLENQGYQVELMQLEALDESKSFLGQCHRAFNKKQAQLKICNFDMTEYDLVCVGTPVWAFGPAPAVNTFLAECKGLSGKKVVIFTTYGSGTGNNRCLNYMKQKLIFKGAKEIQNFSVQQFKIKDNSFVNLKLQDLIKAPVA